MAKIKRKDLQANRLINKKPKAAPDKSEQLELLDDSVNVDEAFLQIKNSIIDYVNCENTSLGPKEFVDGLLLLINDGYPSENISMSGGESHESHSETSDKEFRNSSNFVRRLFPQADSFTARLVAFLEENLDAEDPIGQSFDAEIARNLSGHWVGITRILHNENLKERERMEKLNQLLTKFLNSTQEDLYPWRKNLLVLLAKFCNDVLSQYYFVSPEAFSQVSPSIHDVINVGGTKIKSGISYLVKRMTTNQVVHKAVVLTY